MTLLYQSRENENIWWIILLFVIASVKVIIKVLAVLASLNNEGLKKRISLDLPITWNKKKKTEKENFTAVHGVFNNQAAHEKHKTQVKQTDRYIKANKSQLIRKRNEEWNTQKHAFLVPNFVAIAT